MTVPGRHLDAVDLPDAEEAQGALHRMLESDVLRGSPQLAAFLRYVVETTLRGEADRIKGYTIAIEALGRDETFDPQTDPIVRVEAARLRRAINRYYEGPGSHESLKIELPLGSYVPVFRHVTPAPHGAEAAPPPARQISFSLPRVDWGRIVTGAGLILFGAVIYAMLDFWFDFNTPNPNLRPALAQPQLCAQPPCVAPNALLHSEN
jgi:hypothetical protein